MKNALMVYELEKEENSLDDMRRRLDNLDLVSAPEDPRPSPKAYEVNSQPKDVRTKAYQFCDGSTVPDSDLTRPEPAPPEPLVSPGTREQPLPGDMPVLQSMPCDPNLQPRQIGPPLGEKQVPPEANCRVVPGRHIPTPSCVTVPGHRLPGSASVDPLFSRPVVGGGFDWLSVDPGRWVRPCGSTHTNSDFHGGGEPRRGSLHVLYGVQPGPHGQPGSRC